MLAMAAAGEKRMGKKRYITRKVKLAKTRRIRKQAHQKKKAVKRARRASPDDLSFHESASEYQPDEDDNLSEFDDQIAEFLEEEKEQDNNLRILSQGTLEISSDLEAQNEFQARPNDSTSFDLNSIVTETVRQQSLKPIPENFARRTGILTNLENMAIQIPKDDIQTKFQIEFPTEIEEMEGLTPPTINARPTKSGRMDNYIDFLSNVQESQIIDLSTLQEIEENAVLSRRTLINSQEMDIIETEKEIMHQVMMDSLDHPIPHKLIMSRDFSEIQVFSIKRPTCEDRETCPICMDTFTKNSDDCGYLDCFHWFHYRCVVPWLSRLPQCPVDKSKVTVLMRTDR